MLESHGFRQSRFATTALNQTGRRPALRAALCGLAIAVATGHAALAQSAAPPTPPGEAAEQAKRAVETVVVTAEKRRVNIQKVPIAMTALSSKSLATRGITSTLDLSASVPGLIINNAANVGNPYIRGVGSNLFDPSAEQSVATYVDGVYIPAPEANLFALNDVERIEVLKGPQGTLFGRNATGGVIQIITRDPSQTPYAEASVGYGTYNMLMSSLYATGGITNNLAGDVAVMYANQGNGYGKNLTTGADTFREAIGNIDVRSKLLFKPSDETKITLSIDYAHDVESNAYQKPPGTISPISGAGYPGAYNVNQDLNTFDRVNTGGISLTVNQDAGFMNIVDIASYRSTLVNYPFDDDVTSVPAADVILDEHAHNISEELQLVSKDNGWLKWLLGAYYYKGTGAYPEVFIDGGLQVEDKQITESESGFGQATATFFDTNFTAGVRYTNETQDFSVSEPVQFVKSQGVDRITYRLAVDRQLAEDVMAYFSYNRGFKSGGFNLLDPGNIFKPEILDATEIGIKSELFNKRVRLNLDAFYYNYQDIQLFVAVFGGSIVKNSAGAHTKGVEGDLTVVPIDNLTLNASMAYLDGRYTDDPGAAAITANGVTLPAVNDAGKHTPNTPPFTGAFNASYEIDTPYGSFRPAGSVVYNNGYYWQPDNRLVQPAYTLINASLLWTSTSGKYSAQLWGKNLAQATYYIARISAAGIGDAQEQAPPRTIGLTLKVRF